MIKKIFVFLMVIVCLSVGIEGRMNICKVVSPKPENITISYTYSYLVTYRGECYFGNNCLLSKWITKVKNKTIERPEFEVSSRCCPGYHDISINGTGDLECVPDMTAPMETKPIRYNATSNGTSSLEEIIRSITTTKIPLYNESMPYHWRHTTSTKRYNNDFGPYDLYGNRRYTTTTERNYNDTVPSYRRYTTSTERSYYGPTPDVPRSFRYNTTTSTDRNFNGAVPSYNRYTTTTERNYNDTSSYRRFTTTTERNYNYTQTDTVPYDRSAHYGPRRYINRRYTTTTERNYNDTAPSYRWRYTTTTQRPYYRPVPDVPYNWWDTTTSTTERPYYGPHVEPNWWDATTTKRPYRYTTTTDRPYYGSSETNEFDIWRHNKGDRPSYRRSTTSTEVDIDTTTYRRRYTTSTEKPYYGPVPDVPYNWWDRTTTERAYDTSIPYKYTTTTVRPYYESSEKDTTTSTTTQRYTSTTPYSWRHRPYRPRRPYYRPPGIEDRVNITFPTGPYNRNNRTYKRREPTDDFPHTTSSIDTDRKTIGNMCPKQKWILILSCIILTFTAFCVTLLVWRVILMRKYKSRTRSLTNEGPAGEPQGPQDMYNATYTSTEPEPKAQINNIYPSVTDL